MKTLTKRTFAVWLATLFAASALTAGCSSGDSDSQSNPDSEGSSAVDEPAVETVVTIGKVTGDLAEAERAPLKAAVKEVMDDYFEGAYLGEFPRSSFKQGYAAFTAGARRDAVKRDAALMSNADISSQIERAFATQRRVRLDVLAVKGAARGVTARFTMDFATSGTLEQEQRVKGYLLMVPQGKNWRVFGYNVIKGTLG
ncbi:hypothetical protein [Nocardioides sp.]|uniref:hypothetical protein n=1 Tax=Nocardioides sp. TaxID=35761 RepID=UPI0035651F92